MSCSSNQSSSVVVHRHFVVNAGVLTMALNRPCASQSSPHVPAIRSSAAAMRVPSMRIFFQCIVHAIHSHRCTLVRPVIRNLIREFLPIPRRHAPVDHQRHVSRCGKKKTSAFHGSPGIRPHRLRPPVQQYQQRCIFSPRQIFGGRISIACTFVPSAPSNQNASGAFISSTARIDSF